MSKTVEINNFEVSIKEYRNQRVVTFKDIDMVHERPDGTARKRFNDNKKRFIEGEDFFVRNSDEAKKEYNMVAPNGIVLITEQGYLMLVKSFTDDLAWKVQRQLVKSYFSKNVESEEFSPLLRLLMNMELKQKETDKKLDALEQKSEKQKEVIRAVKETFADTGEEDFRHWAVSVITAIANNPDYGRTKYKYQEAWGESYKRLTDKAGCNLDTLLKNAHKRAKQCGATRAQITTINKLSIIANNKRLKEIYVSVLREMSMAYCLTIA